MKATKIIGGLVASATLLLATTASAQNLPPPQRNETWGTVSIVSAAVGASTQLLMPRIYYADSEATIGWKARYHLSVLAPIMTAAALALTNEYVVHPNIQSYRPGCGPSNAGVSGCESFAMPSTPMFVAFSALGHGTGVFLVDTLKWSEGRVNVGSIVGNIALPLVAGVITAIGRVEGDPSQEHGDQMLLGGAIGLGVGLALGLTYSTLQVPDCGYGSGVICW